MKRSETQYWHSPIGWIRMDIVGGRVKDLCFVRHQKSGFNKPKNGVHARVIRQLQHYFSGKSKAFSLPLDAEGTVFQKRVWAAVQTIPFGETRTYGDIARAIGRPRAARAVGNALKDNPIAILIPCHRVVPVGGKTGRYAWGTRRKKQLLSHETTCAMLRA